MTQNFGPGNGFPAQCLRTLFSLLLLLLRFLLSDFRSTKAFSFHNRSSSNFAYRLNTIIQYSPCTMSDFQLINIFHHQIGYTQRRQQQRCRSLQAASDDTWRIDMKCAFQRPTAPAPASTRWCSRLLKFDTVRLCFLRQSVPFVNKYDKLTCITELWGCKVPTHLALPGPSAAAACTACRSLWQCSWLRRS